MSISSNKVAEHEGTCCRDKNKALTNVGGHVAATRSRPPLWAPRHVSGTKLCIDAMPLRVFVANMPLQQNQHFSQSQTTTRILCFRSLGRKNNMAAIASGVCFRCLLGVYRCRCHGIYINKCVWLEIHEV